MKFSAGDLLGSPGQDLDHDLGDLVQRDAWDLYERVQEMRAEVVVRQRPGGLLADRGTHRPGCQDGVPERLLGVGELRRLLLRGRGRLLGLSQLGSLDLELMLETRQMLLPLLAHENKG